MRLQERDEYPNLILLCKSHHKLVDDQPNTYTAECLRGLKRKHEHSVRETLGPANRRLPSRDRLYVAPRISTGQEALSIVMGADAYEFSNTDLTEDAEVDSISGFFQLLQDWGDFGSEFESGDRVRAGFDLSQRIGELEQMGFGVFGTSEVRKYEVRDGGISLRVAVIRVARLPGPDVSDDQGPIDASQDQSDTRRQP